ncbi:MAG: hypothetical protein ACRD2L_02555, partial [Terriglobia bacterium]
AQMRQGMDAAQATGAEIERPGMLARLAEAHGKVGRVAEGLNLLDEATAVMGKTEERQWEAELYRLKGQLTLQKSKTSLKPVSDKSHTSLEQVTTSQGKLPVSLEAKAEEYFQKAIEIARKQQAKSLELRAAMSLARLWQQQDKQHEAHNMLSEIYHWFTEGFNTKDLQEAKVLLDELA